MSERTCSDCGKGISKYSKTGRCRSCACRKYAYGGPDSFEKRSRVNRKKLEDPAYKDRLLRALRAGNNRAWNDPARRENMALAGRANLKRGLEDPKVRAKWLAGRKAAAAKRSATILGWCPPEYLEEYHRLSRRGDMRAADAKAIILAKLTHFERQMQALRNGARLAEKPVLRKSAPDITLGGVTDWAA